MTLLRRRASLVPPSGWQRPAWFLSSLRAGDRETHAILKFNQMLYTTPELFVTLLPLRDGLAVCHKL